MSKEHPLAWNLLLLLLAGIYPPAFSPLSPVALVAASHLHLLLQRHSMQPQIADWPIQRSSVCVPVWCSQRVHQSHLLGSSLVYENELGQMLIVSWGRIREVLKWHLLVTSPFRLGPVCLSFPQMPKFWMIVAFSRILRGLRNAGAWPRSLWPRDGSGF